jgi:hypothetical protein
MYVITTITVWRLPVTRLPLTKYLRTIISLDWVCDIKSTRFRGTTFVARYIRSSLQDRKIAVITDDMISGEHRVRDLRGSPSVIYRHPDISGFSRKDIFRNTVEIHQMHSKDYVQSDPKLVSQQVQFVAVAIPREGQGVRQSFHPNRSTCSNIDRPLRALQHDLDI